MKKQQPQTITMQDIAANLNLAALEWRAAMHEKREADKNKFKDKAVSMALNALHLNEKSKKRLALSSFYLGASIALFIATLAITAWQVTQ